MNPPSFLSDNWTQNSLLEDSRTINASFGTKQFAKAIVMTMNMIVTLLLLIFRLVNLSLFATFSTFLLPLSSPCKAV